MISSLEYSDEEIEEMQDPENDPKALGKAEDLREELFENLEGSLSSANAKLERALKSLEMIEEMIEEVEEDCPKLLKKVSDAFRSVDEAKVSVSAAEDQCGRQFHSVSLGDKLERWAACRKKFPKLAAAVENLQAANKKKNAKLRTLQDRENEARSRIARLESEAEALDPLT